MVGVHDGGAGFPYRKATRSLQAIQLSNDGGVKPPFFVVPGPNLRAAGRAWRRVIIGLVLVGEDCAWQGLLDDIDLLAPKRCIRPPFAFAVPLGDNSGICHLSSAGRRASLLKYWQYLGKEMAIRIPTDPASDLQLERYLDKLLCR